jgi:hypothetical protein
MGEAPAIPRTFCGRARSAILRLGIHARQTGSRIVAESRLSTHCQQCSALQAPWSGRETKNEKRKTDDARSVSHSNMSCQVVEQPYI